MFNNQVMRSLRNLLEADPAQLVELAALAGGERAPEEVEGMLRRHGEPGWRDCDDLFLAQLLEGLVIHQRGRDESRPPRPIETPVTNNMVLKKLRAAFELQEEDLHAIFDTADVQLSKGELNGLFRKPDNKHFRPCSDELLEAFLEGLAMSGVGGEEGEEA